ncbi:MAG: hypothetical protein NW226_23655 [Microscillaceae bacterium]|nr:hypothetical protein [Microscillaceae bacterium]
MANISETSFGNRLARAQELLDFIKTLGNYTPPNLALGQEKFSALLRQVDETNKKVVSVADLLNQARATRLTLYYGKEGLIKRCAMVRDFVGALPGGKTSSAYLSIQKENQKMNSYKKPTKKEESSGDSETPAKRIVSTAEAGFGALLQSTKHILEIIKNLPDYAPSNARITLEGLGKLISDVEAANQLVNTNLYAYSDAVAKRLELYEGEQGLRLCFQGIKAFIAGNYGKTSAEFKAVSKIKY